MAKYRQIQTDFWCDGFVLDLTPEEKYFYLYIMTNPKTSQCGIYELPKRVIEMETGYNRETVDKFLKRFKEYKKIDYCDETKEIMIKNWLKYNEPNNINAIKCVNKELKNVKNSDFVIRFYEQCVSLELNVNMIFQGIEVNIPNNKGNDEVSRKDSNVEEKEQDIRGLQGAYKGLASKEVISNKQEVISNKEEAEVISNKENIQSKDKKIGVAAASSNTLQDIFIFFEKNMYEPKELEYKRIIGWANKVSCDVIIMAIEEAVEYNAKTLKYLENIINNWYKKGIDTPQKVVEYKKSWTKRNSTSNKKTSAWDYSGQRVYDFEKLEKGLLGWDQECG